MGIADSGHELNILYLVGCMLDVGEDTSNGATAICVPGVVGHGEYKMWSMFGFVIVLPCVCHWSLIYHSCRIASGVCLQCVLEVTDAHLGRQCTCESVL